MKPTPDSLPLRDIHLPDPVSWWPPAPGWWLLPMLLLVATGMAWWWRTRFRARHRLPRAARRELDGIRARHARDGDDRALVASLSILLRRASLSHPASEPVAGLTGEAWLAWLDRGLGGDDFRNGAGRALVDAPYQARPEVDAAALLRLCERWLRRHLEAVR